MFNIFFISCMIIIYLLTILITIILNKKIRFEILSLRNTSLFILIFLSYHFIYPLKITILIF